MQSHKPWFLNKLLTVIQLHSFSLTLQKQLPAAVHVQALSLFLAESETFPTSANLTYCIRSWKFACLGFFFFFSLPEAFMRVFSTAQTSSDNTKKFLLVTQTELLSREHEGSSSVLCHHEGCDLLNGHNSHRISVLLNCHM